MQVRVFALVPAFKKFGMAIAAKIPMIATTIMISTSVKPDSRDVFIFIICSICFVFIETAVGFNTEAGVWLHVLSNFLANCQFSGYPQFLSGNPHLMP